MRIPSFFSKPIIIHPFLLAICPLLSLYILNQEIVRFEIFLQVSLIILVIMTVTWIVLSFLLKSFLKASIFISTFLFLFLSFRYLFFGVSIIGLIFGNYENSRRLIETKPAIIIGFMICFLIYAIFAFFIKRYNSKLSKMSKLLNIISSAWLLTILISNISILTKTQQVNIEFFYDWITKINSEPCAVSVNNDRLPDIYYILLDEYTRDDVLQDIYQIDNSNFLDFLEKQGFYVARDSRSNYKRTTLSLNSTLNFNFLDQLSAETGLDAISKGHLYTAIDNNRTFHQLRCLGYKIISFDTGFIYSDLSTADIVYSPSGIPSRFEILLLENTPLMTFMYDQPYNWHRERITYMLRKLPEIASEDGPKFVFVHVLSPHTPFVFGPNGEPNNPQMLFTLNDGYRYRLLSGDNEYFEGYREQVVYISKLASDSIRGILENSIYPPIIIIQGDHGPALHYDDNLLEKTDVQERFSILNAYYFPGIEGVKFLYSSITPVNTFRIIFNTYFGANYPLVEDKSYYSPDNDVEKFIDVTNLIADNPLK